MLVRRLVIASKTSSGNEVSGAPCLPITQYKCWRDFGLLLYRYGVPGPKSMVWQNILSRILWDRVDRARSYLHTSPGMLLAWGRGKLQEGKRTMSGYTPIIVHGLHRVAGDSVARGALRETRRPGLALIPARTRAGSCAVGGRFWSGNSK